LSHWKPAWFNDLAGFLSPKFRAQNSKTCWALTFFS